MVGSLAVLIVFARYMGGGELANRRCSVSVALFSFCFFFLIFFQCGSWQPHGNQISRVLWRGFRNALFPFRLHRDDVVSPSSRTLDECTVGARHQHAASLMQRGQTGEVEEVSLTCRRSGRLVVSVSRRRTSCATCVSRHALKQDDVQPILVHEWKGCRSEGMPCVHPSRSTIPVS